MQLFTYSEVLFVQEVSGAYTSLLLDIRKLTMALRARKVSRAFEKRVPEPPGVLRSYQLLKTARGLRWIVIVNVIRVKFSNKTIYLRFRQALQGIWNVCSRNNSCIVFRFSIYHIKVWSHPWKRINYVCHGLCFTRRFWDIYCGWGHYKNTNFLSTAKT